LWAKYCHAKRQLRRLEAAITAANKLDVSVLFLFLSLCVHVACVRCKLESAIAAADKINVSISLLPKP
jgi:hypothetical protein